MQVANAGQLPNANQQGQHPVRQEEKKQEPPVPQAEFGHANAAPANEKKEAKKEQPGNAKQQKETDDEIEKQIRQMLRDANIDIKNVYVPKGELNIMGMNDLRTIVNYIAEFKKQHQGVDESKVSKYVITWDPESKKPLSIQVQYKDKQTNPYKTYTRDDKKDSKFTEQKNAEELDTSDRARFTDLENKMKTIKQQQLARNNLSRNGVQQPSVGKGKPLERPN